MRVRGNRAARCPAPPAWSRWDVGHRHHGQVVDADLVEGFIQVVDRAGRGHTR